MVFVKIKDLLKQINICDDELCAKFILRIIKLIIKEKKISYE